MTTCTECKTEYDQSENLNLNYEGSSDFDFCSIDCVFRHVVLEIMADDRTTSEISLMLYTAERIYEENL